MFLLGELLLQKFFVDWKVNDPPNGRILLMMGA